MGELDREKITAHLNQEDDFTGAHEVNDVVRWASREAMVAAPNILSIIDAVGKKGHGRLIVMSHPADDSEWGAIGCALPLNEDVSQVLLAFASGHIYSVSDINHDRDGDDDDDDDTMGWQDPRNFVDTFYPNRDPLRVSASEIEVAEERLILWGLPFDRSSLAASTNPAQVERIREDISRALELTRTVDFHAKRAASIEAAKQHLFDGLGELIGLEKPDEQQ